MIKILCVLPGSVSPSKGRARSTGPVHSARRSRVDVAHKTVAGGETAAADTNTQPSTTATATAATAVAPSATSQRLSRVKSMPSKLNADQKPPNTASTSTSAAARSQTPTTKRTTKSAVPNQAATSTGGTVAPPTGSKPMPATPKAMAPRAVPKEPKSMKEVTANKPITSHKVFCIALLLHFPLVMSLLILITVSRF